MTQAPLLLEREDLERLCFLLTHLADDRESPNAFLQSMFDRADVENWVGLINEMLAYDGPGVRHLTLVPATFHVRGYHTQWVDEFEAEMPESLRARARAHLAIARHAAELVDNAEYSTDFRLSSRTALQDVMNSLQRLTDDEAEAELEETQEV